VSPMTPQNVTKCLTLLLWIGVTEIYTKPGPFIFLSEEVDEKSVLGASGERITMPKVKKMTRTAFSSSGARQQHEPLGQEIQKDVNRQLYAVPSGRQKKKQRAATDDGGGHEGSEVNQAVVLDEKSSRRILELSRAQQLEMAAREHDEQQRRRTAPRATSLKSQDDSQSDDDDDENDEESDNDDDGNFLAERDDQGYVNIVDGMEGLGEDDEALIASMMRKSNSSQANHNDQEEAPRTLADIIMAKIAEKEEEKNRLANEDDFDPTGDPMSSIPPKVIEVYTEIGKLLSRYTSGKLPKAFKVIPSLSNWEEILYITRPDQWTPQAMYAATKIFASNLNPKMAQRFYFLVLLDAIRADIQQHKKLNYHYYQSLKKAIYKPAAFFKGILLPLCRSEQACTLREAAIIASSLQHTSIPSHHAAVAIHKIAAEHANSYNGVTSIFIKTLLNKKYALPAPVIHSVASHFISFIDVSPATELPVLWHQSLLVFVQRYKNALSTNDEVRESLRVLLKKHFHHRITPEIRRELFGAQAYQEERREAMLAARQGSSMVVDSEKTENIQNDADVDMNN
jgi:essential nuclear protein 1